MSTESAYEAQITRQQAAAAMSDGQLRMNFNVWGMLRARLEGLEGLEMHGLDERRKRAEEWSEVLGEGMKRRGMG